MMGQIRYTSFGFSTVLNRKTFGQVIVTAEYHHFNAHANSTYHTHAAIAHEIKVQRGSGWIGTPRGIQRIGAGDVIHIPCNMFHAIKASGDGLGLIVISQGRDSEQDRLIRFTDWDDIRHDIVRMSREAAGVYA